MACHDNKSIIGYTGLEQQYEKNIEAFLASRPDLLWRKRRSIKKQRQFESVMC